MHICKNLWDFEENQFYLQGERRHNHNLSEFESHAINYQGNETRE